MSKKRVTLERTYPAASLEDVWDLWTTKDGIESWWGPDGFRVVVQKIDLRPGGDLLYTMSAVGPEQIAFMKQAGMPASTEHRLTYTDVTPRRRLAYMHVADFIPGVGAYDVDTSVDLFPTNNGVRMVLTFDAMHDDLWTSRATMGWENELDNLGKVLNKESVK